MEHGEVSRVDFVSTINISNDKEVVKAWTKEIHLMGCAMGPQQVLPVDIVAVTFGSAGMIFWDQQRVEVLFRGDNRAEIVVDAEQGCAFGVCVFLVEVVGYSLSN